METRSVIKGTWLTRKPNRYARASTWALGLFVLIAAFLYFSDAFDSQEWMPASRELALERGQVWRLWTALFAHADLGHLLSNLFLFVPFAYFLTAYFGGYFFPAFGLFLGGLINVAVLSQMPEKASLIGISGVVHWMAAAWLTLYFLIERGERKVKRFAKVLIVSLVLFIPETYKPEVSYLSHFLGFVLGAASAGLFYLWNRKKFRAAEVVEVVHDEDFEEAV